MKTHFFLMSTMAVLGTALLATSYAASNSEYVHLTRHRDSNGNLLMAPTQHQAEPSVMQKMVMPSQPKTLEQRSTDWGMSVQEVKDNERVQSSWDLQSPVLADDEQRVAYHTQIEGIDAALTYSFYENHLGQAKYVFEPQHEDAVEFVQDFNTVKDWIQQSYGEPTSVQEIWLDTLYQYDQSLWGQAVMRGHLVMVAEWNNPGTDIVLMLDGGDDAVGLVADFSSTTFVVPVLYDTESSEENIEATLEDQTNQEAMPTEPAHDEHAARNSEAIEHEILDEQPIDEQHLVGQGTLDKGVEQDRLIEPAVTIQEPAHPMDMSELMPLDSSAQEPSAAGHQVEEHAVETQVPEHTMDVSEAMPVEAVMEEPTAVAPQVKEHAVETQVQEHTMDVSETMPAEAAAEEPATAVHQSEEQAVEHAIDEHANVHSIEAEVDSQHHL